MSWSVDVHVVLTLSSIQFLSFYSVLSRTMSRQHESMFDDPDVAAELAEIHEKFVVVPADKASNNIMFVCKTHYINCLMEEFGMSTMTGNPTYNLTAMSKEEILQNHH